MYGSGLKLAHSLFPLAQVWFFTDCWPACVKIWVDDCRDFLPDQPLPLCWLSYLSWRPFLDSLVGKGCKFNSSFSCSAQGQLGKPDLGRRGRMMKPVSFSWVSVSVCLSRFSHLDLCAQAATLEDVLRCWWWRISLIGIGLLINGRTVLDKCRTKAVLCCAGLIRGDCHSRSPSAQENRVEQHKARSHESDSYIQWRRNFILF